MIVDCFTFFNELDLLEIRLNELHGHVDFHVLVESPLTFTGQRKPLVFADHRSRFRAFDIRYVVVNDMPTTPNPWDREAWQRDAILRGLDGSPDETEVLISDVDEIPRATSLPSTTTTPGQIRYFSQQFFYYTLRHHVIGQWFGTRLARLDDVRRWTPQFIRSRGSDRIAHGGWHFSYLGSPETISTKIRAFSHQEYNNPQFNTIERISRVVKEGTDLFDRPQMQIELLSGLDHLPNYVQRHHRKFAHLFGGHNGSDQIEA